MLCCVWGGGEKGEEECLMWVCWVCVCEREKKRTRRPRRLIEKIDKPTAVRLPMSMPNAYVSAALDSRPRANSSGGM